MLTDHKPLMLAHRGFCFLVIGATLQRFGQLVKRGSLMVLLISQCSEPLKTRLTGVCHLLRT